MDILAQENLWGYRKRLGFFRAQLAARFPDRPPAAVRILDVGCGNGSMLTIPLARLDYTVTGLDPDARSIARARELALGLALKARPEGLSVEFVCGTLADLDPAACFDAVICAEVLEHFDDPAGLLRDCARRLEPRGLVLLSTPNGYGPFEIESFIYYGLRLDRLAAALRRGSAPLTTGLAGRPVRRFDFRSPSRVPLCGIEGQAQGRPEGFEGRPAYSEELSGTENIECRHQQRFTRRRLQQLFAAAGLCGIARGTGSWLCGPFSAHTLGHLPALFDWNARIADEVPGWFQSSWYFALEKAG